MVRRSEYIGYKIKASENENCTYGFCGNSWCLISVDWFEVNTAFKKVKLDRADIIKT